MVTTLLSLFAVGTCDRHWFFGLPTWYEYLVKAGKMQVDPGTNRCEFVGSFQVADLSLIALALVDIALRVAAIIAVGYIVYGGILFITAQGEAEKIKRARQTAINALIGLTIALIAVGVVAFIGRSIG